MYLFVNIGALILIICGAYGDGVPNVATAVSPTFNPYYANRNPVVPGYDPYYNSANARVPILSYSSTQGVDGSYSFSYSTGDGKQAQETGFLKDAYIDKTGASQGTQVKEGSFGYISPEGLPIQVSYVADENGFRPAGIHISGDGKGALPAPLLDGVKGSQIYDPRYNFYNPYNRNRAFGQYNTLNPYDPSYPYDPRYDLYNPYRAGAYNKVVKDEVKKESA